MKILMLLESEFPPDVRVENEISALSSAGHIIHIACTTKTGRVKFEKKDGYLIHRKSIGRFIHKSSVGCLKFPFYFNFWRRFIGEILSNEKFDVVHIHDLPLASIGLEIKKRFQIPFIIDLHENWPALLRNAPHTQTLAGKLLSSDSQWIKYEKRMISEADLVITIIEEARDRIISLGVDPGKVCIVSNTIRTEGLSLPLRKRNYDGFLIFYGGGINRHRGLQVVLEALKILQDKNLPVRLMIVGSGSYTGELKSLAGKLSIESQVEFSGHKPFAEMMELLSLADVAIIPHLRTDNNDASSPNKLYQYMYLEKPVIASDCISLKRIISETDSGYIYGNDSPGELAELIKRILENKEALILKGKNGKKAVSEKLNWNTDANRLREAYKLLETPDS